MASSGNNLKVVVGLTLALLMSFRIKTTSAVESEANSEQEKYEQGVEVLDGISKNLQIIEFIIRNNSVQSQQQKLERQEIESRRITQAYMKNTIHLHHELEFKKKNHVGESENNKLHVKVTKNRTLSLANSAFDESSGNLVKDMNVSEITSYKSFGALCDNKGGPVPEDDLCYELQIVLSKTQHNVQRVILDTDSFQNSLLVSLEKNNQHLHNIAEREGELYTNIRMDTTISMIKYLSSNISEASVLMEQHLDEVKDQLYLSWVLISVMSVLMVVLFVTLLSTLGYVAWISARRKSQKKKKSVRLHAYSNSCYYPYPRSDSTGTTYLPSMDMDNQDDEYDIYTRDAYSHPRQKQTIQQHYNKKKQRLELNQQESIMKHHEQRQKKHQQQRYEQRQQQQKQKEQTLHQESSYASSEAYSASDAGTPAEYRYSRYDVAGLEQPEWVQQKYSKV